MYENEREKLLRKALVSGLKHPHVHQFEDGAVALLERKTDDPPAPDHDGIPFRLVAVYRSPHYAMKSIEYDIIHFRRVMSNQAKPRKFQFTFAGAVVYTSELNGVWSLF